MAALCCAAGNTQVPPAPPPHHRDGGYQNNHIEFEPKGLPALVRWKLQATRAGLPRPPEQPIPQVKPELGFIHSNARAGLAIKVGVDRACKTLDNVTGAWVQDQKLSVHKGKIVEYRVNATNRGTMTGKGSPRFMADSCSVISMP